MFTLAYKALFKAVAFGRKTNLCTSNVGQRLFAAPLLNCPPLFHKTQPLWPMMWWLECRAPIHPVGRPFIEIIRGEAAYKLPLLNVNRHICARRVTAPRNALPLSFSLDRHPDDFSAFAVRHPKYVLPIYVYISFSPTRTYNSLDTACT